MEELKEKVDEYAEAALEEKAAKKVKGHAKPPLEFELEREGVDDDEPFSFIGNNYLISVSARSEETDVKDIASLYRLLGHDRFLALASFSIQDLREALSEHELGTVTETKRTGSRRWSAAKINRR